MVVPRYVDPVQRREEIARALWRVIARDGLENASVRKVAREADLSAGSLRHYFQTQAELMSFAMRLVVEQVESRIAALGLDPDHPEDPRSALRRALLEVLPIDEERRLEMEVWLAFTARSLVVPELRELGDAAYDQLRSACRRRLIPLIGRGRGLEAETDRLFALVDGLALHVAMRPEQMTPRRVRSVLAHHLDQLAR